MAYRQFDDEPGADWACRSTGRHDITTPALTRLTAQERQVVQLSLRDTIATLRTPGAMVQKFRWFFGQKTANRLASPRLEALRRFAILRRIQGLNMPDSELDILIEAGFDHGLLPELDSLLRDGRTAR